MFVSAHKQEVFGEFRTFMLIWVRQRNSRTGTSRPSGGKPQHQGSSVQPQGPKRPASQGKVSRPNPSKGKSSAAKSHSRSGSKSSKGKKKNR